MSARINIYGVVGTDVTPTGIAQELKDANGDPVVVYVNSPGGDAYAGITIAHQLTAYPGRVTAIVEGLAASAASIIITGADTVSMFTAAEIMIHEAGATMAGNSAEFAATAAQLDRLSANMATLYAEHTGTPAEEWRQAMQAETWFTADQAVKAGLAKKVIPGKAVPKPTAHLNTANKTAPNRTLLKETETMDTITLDADHIERLKVALDLDELDADTLVDKVEELTKADQTPAEEPAPAAPAPTKEALAEALAEAKAEARAQALTSTWIEEGRFSSALRDKVVRLATIDPKLAREAFGSRPKGSIPRKEIGYGVDPTANGDDEVPGTGKKWVR